MKNLTLLIPAKKEKESLPQVLNELKNFNYQKLIIVQQDDMETINSVKEFNKTFLGEIPIFQKVGSEGDKGKPIVESFPEHEASKIYIEIAKKITASKQAIARFILLAMFDDLGNCIINQLM